MMTGHLLLAVELNPKLSKLVILGVIVIGLGVLLRILRQPYVIAYILAGVLLGEDGFGIILDYTYQLGIAVISLTLLISPFWIGFTRRLGR